MNKNNNFVIISDSSCDLSDELISKYNIEVIPYYISFDGQNYLKEGKDIKIRDFYIKLDSDSTLYPKTALPSIGDYKNVFEKHLKDGKDIICVCLSSKFSGSYNSACVAKSTLEEKYPNNKINIIDSTHATALQALFVLELAKMQSDNIEYDKIIEIIPALKESGRIFFTVGNLEYLIKGGRIGKLAGMLGDKINLKPIIMLNEGELLSSGVAFTRKKSFLKAVSLAMQYFTDNNESMDDYSFSTGYGLDLEEGTSFYEKFKTMINRDDVVLVQIGATIGVYTGPYPIGVAFIKKYQKFLNC